MQKSSTEIDGLKILLATHSCLIFDPSKSSVINLRLALRQFGMDPEKTLSAQTFEEAQALLSEKKPTVLIVDFHQESSEPFRLLESFEKMHAESSRVALLLISGETMPLDSDGQVDGHVVKPFSVDRLRRTLLKAMITKFYPDTYMKKVLEADILSQGGQDEVAQREYDLATTMNPKPFRAHRGLALLHARHGRMNEALVEFRKARAFSPRDYKSVTGEFDILRARGDVTSAADLLPVLRESLPRDPVRLKQLFETVTLSERFEELGPLLKLFRELSARNDELVDAVQDAFFAAGRTAMATQVSAFEFFDAGFRIETRRFEYLEKVVREFLLIGRLEDAEKFLAKTLPEQVGSAAYQRICFELDCLVLPIDDLLVRGRKLVFDGHGTPEIFSTVVALFGRAGNETMAEAVIAKATENFPTLRDKLYEVLSHSIPEEEFRKAA
jgi:DNA-binding NarL/FixJ family response regulator